MLKKLGPTNSKVPSKNFKVPYNIYRFRRRKTTLSFSALKLYRRRVGKYIFGLATLLFVVVLVYFGVHFIEASHFFYVRHINIYGTSKYVNKQDLQRLAFDLVQDVRIFNLDQKLAEDSLKESFLGAKDIKIVKKLPQTLEIHVSEREPLAVLRNEVGSNSPTKFFLVDKDGYVLGMLGSNAAAYPEISYSGEIQVGMFLDRKLIPVYFELLRSLEANEVLGSSIAVSDTEIEFYANNTTFILLGRERSTFQSVTAAGRLLKQLALEGKKAKKIDLRYDKVIVQLE